MEYLLKRSRRKTLSLEITRELEILVRAPMRLPRRDIDRFVADHGDWVETHLERRRQLNAANPEPDEAQTATLIQAAREILPDRVAYFAALMGLAPAGITITSARTRFGSCSGKNRLSFSWRLMRYSPEAVDYVVVHELAHIVHKNHGREFYALIESYLPDWKARRAMLKAVTKEGGSPR